MIRPADVRPCTSVADLIAHELVQHLGLRDARPAPLPVAPQRRPARELPTTLGYRDARAEGGW